MRINARGNLTPDYDKSQDICSQQVFVSRCTQELLGFAAAFLKYLAQVRVDPRFLSFTLYLERPKTTKVRKAITGRIVTRADITCLFERIDACAEKGKIRVQKTRNYRAFALLASYTGLRPSTMQRLTAGQFKAAIKEEKPVLHVLAEQEKNRAGSQSIEV